MLNTKQANPSKLQFMHCNIENTEAQTDFSFSLFLTSGLISMFTVCTVLLVAYKNLSNNLELHILQLRNCMQCIIFHEVDVSRPLLRRDPHGSILVKDHLSLPTTKSFHFRWLLMGVSSVFRN